MEIVIDFPRAAFVLLNCQLFGAASEGIFPSKMNVYNHWFVSDDFIWLEWILVYISNEGWFDNLWFYRFVKDFRIVTKLVNNLKSFHGSQKIYQRRRNHQHFHSSSKFQFLLKCFQSTNEFLYKIKNKLAVLTLLMERICLSYFLNSLPAQKSIYKHANTRISLSPDWIFFLLFFFPRKNHFSVQCVVPDASSRLPFSLFIATHLAGLETRTSRPYNMSHDLPLLPRLYCVRNGWRRARVARTLLYVTQNEMQQRGGQGKSLNFHKREKSSLSLCAWESWVQEKLKIHWEINSEDYKLLDAQ